MTHIPYKKLSQAILLATVTSCMSSTVYATALHGHQHDVKHSVVKQQLQASKPNIVSNAFNYKKNMSIAVNDRTGQVTINLSLGGLIGLTSSGLQLNLNYAIYQANTHYSVIANTANAGVMTHWTLALPYVSNPLSTTPTLHLGDGSSYQYDPDVSGSHLDNYSLSNLVFQKVSGGFELINLNGSKTLFDQNGNVTSIENALGQKTSFTVNPDNNQVTSITNKDNTITFTPDQASNGVTITLPETDGQKRAYHISSQVNSGGNGTSTISIQDPSSQTTKFTVQASGYITNVSYPTGLQQSFMLNSQTINGNPFQWINQSSLAGQSETLQQYYHLNQVNPLSNNGTANYFFDPQCSTSDCVMKTKTDYLYTVTSFQRSPKNDGTWIETVKTYNHLHLLVSTQEVAGIKDPQNHQYDPNIDQSFSKNYTWYAYQKGNSGTYKVPSMAQLTAYFKDPSADPSFNSYLPDDKTNQLTYQEKPANYQSPVMQLSVLTKDGHKRVMVTTTQYNDFGQTTQVTKYELVNGQFKKIAEQVSTYDNPTSVSPTSTQYGVLLTSTNTVYDPKTGLAVKTTETKNTPDTTFPNLISTSTQSVQNYEQGKPLPALVLSETHTTYAPAMIDGKTNPFVGKPLTQTVTKHYGTVTENAETQTSYQFADNVTIDNDAFIAGSWQTQAIQRTFTKLLEVTSTSLVNNVPQSRSISYVDPATGNTVRVIKQVVVGSLTAKPVAWITMSDDTSAYDVKGRVISQTAHLTGKSLYVVYDDTKHTVTEYGNTKNGKGGGKKLAATPGNDVATTPVKKIQFNEFGQPVTTYSNANPGFSNSHIHTAALSAANNPDNGNYGNTLHEISHVTYSPNTGMKDSIETFAIPASSTLLQAATPTQLTNTTYQYDQFGRVLDTETTCNGNTCPGTDSTGVTTHYTYQDAYVQPTGTSSLLQAGAGSDTLSNKGKVTTTTTYQGGTASGVDLAQSQVKNNLGEVLTQSVTPLNTMALQSTENGKDIPSAGVSTTRTYNNLGQVTEQDVYHNGVLAQRTQYIYDPIYGSVNITNVTDLGNELPSTDQHQAIMSTNTFYDINGKTIATLTMMTNAYGKNKTTYYLSPLHIYDSSIPGDPLVETLPFNSGVAENTAKLVGNTSFTQISNDWLKAAASACPSSSATNATFDCKHQVKFDYDTLKMNAANGKQYLVHAGLLNQEKFWGGTDYWYFYGQITGTRTLKDGQVLNIWYPVKTDSCYTVAPASGGAAPAPLQNCGQSFPASAFTYSPYTNPVTTSTAESGGHVHWTYNNKGKVTAIIGEVPTDNAEHMIPGPISYAYNNEDQLTSITYPGFPHAKGAAAVPHSMYYSYDNHGNESQVQDYAGNVTTYTYQQGTGGKWLIASATQNDPTGKPIGSVAYQYFNNNATLNKCVNATGLPSVALGPKGEKCAEFTSYTYTPDTGEVKTIDNAFVNYKPDGKTLMPKRTLNLSYTYFLDGNMKSKTLDANFNLQNPSDLTKPTSYTKQYSYVLDKLYGVKVASSKNASFLPAPGTNALSYQYSAAGNLLQAPHYGEKGGAPNGVDKMTYNDVNQIHSYVPGGSSSN